MRSRIEQWILVAYFAVFGHLMIDPVMSAASQNIVRAGRLRAAALAALLLLTRALWTMFNPLVALWVLWVLGRWLLGPYNARAFQDLLFLFSLLTVGWFYVRQSTEFKARTLTILAWAGVLHSISVIAGRFGFHVYGWLIEHGVSPYFQFQGGSHPMDYMAGDMPNGDKFVLHGQVIKPNAEHLAASFYKTHGTLGTGLMDQQTISGAFIAAVAYLHLMAKPRRIAFLICAAGVIASGSSFSILAFIAAGITWSAYSMRPRNFFVTMGGLLSIGAAIMATIAFSFPDLANDNGRLLWWRVAIEWWQERPLTGWGWGSWQQAVTAYAKKMGIPSGSVFNDIHSDPIEVLFKHGVVGATILTAGVMLFFLKLRERQDGSDREVIFGHAIMTTALFANSLGNFTHQVMPHAMMAFIGWLVVAGNWRSDGNLGVRLHP